LAGGGGSRTREVSAAVNTDGPGDANEGERGRARATRRRGRWRRFAFTKHMHLAKLRRRNKKLINEESWIRRERERVKKRKGKRESGKVNALPSEAPSWEEHFCWLRDVRFMNWYEVNSIDDWLMRLARFMGCTCTGFPRWQFRSTSSDEA
jgi:hypothetical protein